MRPIALAVLASCALSGCTLMGSKGPTKTEFDFGPEARAPRVTTPSTAQLHVAEITAAPWMDGTAMYYRLAYDNPAVPRTYAQSEWVMSPAALLTERLRLTVAPDSSATQPVAVHAAGPYALRAELIEFEQIFDTPDHSRGVIRLRVTLEGEGVWSQRTFVIDRPAPAPNAAGGVTALTECADELVARVDEWVRASGTTGEEGSRIDQTASRGTGSAPR